MKSFLTHQKYIGGIFLFFFLFSANALLYSYHFVVEFGHDDHSMISSSGNSDSSGSTMVVANHQHEGDQGEHHEDGESSWDSHSHASIPCQPLSYMHSPRLITNLSGEPFRFIPEVYLDKFIPPQNIA